VSRYRLYPSAEQEKVLLEHCAHARFVWNLGNEQRLMYRPGRGRTPDWYEQSRQLTEAREAELWLAAGSAIVQQQALRDLDHAWQMFFAGKHRRPGWRKQRHHEGFRIIGRRGRRSGCAWEAERLSRHWGRVKIPKVGWVRFRWSRAVPAEAKSYRVKRDPSGRWHVAFAVIPKPIPGPGSGDVVGIDLGVKITAALSNGARLHCPTMTARERAGIRKAQRRAARAPKDSAARDAEYVRKARLFARDADRRKDWAEKASTDIARRFDVIRVEDLQITNLVAKPKPKPDPDRPGAFLPNGASRKAGLNRVIHAQGWGFLIRRLAHKASGRVEKVNPAFTSLRCSDCGWVDKDSRKSQAEYVCTNCSFTCNADLNAALNIAAGHAGGTVRPSPPSVREPLKGAA
jgi:transposase